MGDKGGLVVMWMGKFHRAKSSWLMEMKKIFPTPKQTYLTRLETRMNPSDMNEDIIFTLDDSPRNFNVHITHEILKYYDKTRKKYGLEPKLIFKFFKSVEDGDFARVKRYIEKGADVNAQDSDGDTVLSLASRNGHQEVVRLLIEEGADVNAKTSWGTTALNAASATGHPEVARLLIEEGADVNAKTSRGITSLLFASRNGHTEVVKLLIEEGADVNAQDNDGDTAFKYTLEEGYTDIVKLLIEAGAKE